MFRGLFFLLLLLLSGCSGNSLSERSQPSKDTVINIQEWNARIDRQKAIDDSLIRHGLKAKPLPSVRRHGRHRRHIDWEHMTVTGFVISTVTGLLLIYFTCFHRLRRK